MTDIAKPEKESKQNWQAAIEAAIAFPEEPIPAITFRRSWNSAARPIVKKGKNNGKQV